MNNVTSSTFNAVGGDQYNNYVDCDPYREWRDITEWLSKLNFKASQSDFLQIHEKDTGKWLLESPTFHFWRDGVSQVLWCPGNPGAGKTILASVVVNHLQSSFADDNVGITCIYCNYKEQTLQTTTSLVASLLKQLVQDSPTITDRVKAFYQRHQKTNTFPTLDEVTTTLEAEIETYSKVFIIVDGLDECSESDGSRANLLRVLRSLSGSINIMVTSRDMDSIQQHFREALRIYIRATDGDVKKFIQSQLDNYPDLITLRDIITTKIVENVKGMFLLARLHMNTLVQHHSEKGVIEALDNLPSKINDIYDQAMDRIEQQPEPDKELGKRILSWITYARRPLTLKELRHALAVSPGMTKMDPTALVFPSKLTSVCAGLVVINSRGTIRLAHYTTQQYFEKQRESRFPNAEADIAATCLRYLSFEAFACHYCKGNGEFEFLLKENPFLDYAAQNWGHHGRRHQESIRSCAMDFLQDDSKVACASQVMLVSRRDWYQYSQEFPKNFSGLHMTVFFDLDQIAHHQLENGSNPNLMDGDGRTPLIIAAMEGSQEAVIMLIEHDDVHADSKDSDGRTPLLYAAWYGRGGVVKLLAARDEVDADSKDKYGRTPLSYAASFGHEGVVKLLVARDDVDANSQSKRGRTPLSYAAHYGCEGVVKLLVARDDVHADSKDPDGRTPLLYAAWHGQEGVVKLLIGRDDVDANSKDSDGRTPLLYAAWYGQEGVVKLLIARDGVDADSKDEHGRTPLSYAAWYGHEGAAKLLIAHKVDINAKDSIGRAPLSYAAHYGCEGVAKLLVGCDTIVADSKDSDGLTPLSHAAWFGHKGVVKLLVARGDVDANSKDSNGLTPLSYGAWFGREDVVKLLIAHKDVEADSKDSDGLTPYLYAAMSGQIPVARLLAKKTRTFGKPRTSLKRKFSPQRERVPKLLAKRRRANVEPRTSLKRKCPPR